MSDNNMNQMPDGMNPNGADGPQPSQNQQGDAGQQYSADQQYAGQYGQQQYGANQQYAGQYGQQQYGANQQYAGQYGQQQYDANQQFADQYGQQMNAQQSVYDQTVNMYGDQAHKPESPKKRKGIKIAIIAVVAALVIIAAFVVVFFVFIKKSPKDAVKDAMENTAKELENNNIVGIVGADDIDVDKLDVQSDFTIDKVAGDGKLDGSTFTFDASTAKSDGQNSFKLGSSMTLAG